jgi:uncharacterized protein HemX
MANAKPKNLDQKPPDTPANAANLGSKGFTAKLPLVVAVMSLVLGITSSTLLYFQNVELQKVQALVEEMQVDAMKRTIDELDSKLEDHEILINEMWTSMDQLSRDQITGDASLSLQIVTIQQCLTELSTAVMFSLYTPNC